MNVEEIDKDLSYVKGYETKGHDAGLPRRQFDESPVGNAAKEVEPVSHKFQKVVVVSEHRRFSPRLKHIPDSEKPYYGSTRKKSTYFSCKFQNLVSEHRGFSPRLKHIPESNRPYYGSTTRKNSRHCLAYVNREENGDSGCSDHIKTPDHNLESKLHTDICVSAKTRSAIKKDKLSGLEKDKRRLSTSTTSTTSADKSAYAKVKKTMKLYDKYYLQAVQEEDTRCSTNADANTLKRKSRNENGKHTVKRPDLKAITKMKQADAILYPKKQFGHLPGIDVGYQFYSRAAMVALGFHSHWLWGIDYIGKSSKKYENHKLPLAVAIVLSGCYEDDQDNKEDIIYTGQGGNDLLGKKHQVESQKMTRGNLALKNNMKQRVPVRVVRGHQYDKNKVYTYDGLYQVVDYWTEKGLSGFDVFKYRLRRITGQPQLTTNQVHFINGKESHMSSTKVRTVCEDISGGQEKIPIRVINEVDDTPAPSGFTYTASNQIGKNIKLPSSASGCKCIGICTNPKICACARLNGPDFPYVRQGGGRLVEAKDVVLECGPNCGCGPKCINRISQQGIKYKLEIFRTYKKGWAVRTLELIPSGAIVCEYTGLLRRADELNNITVNSYIMEIDCLQTMKGLGGRQKRKGNVSTSLTDHLENASDDSDEDPEFGIDAGSMGNVSRFINHSCDPNLFVQCVLSAHHDPRFAQVFLVASENIPPLQELSYDYNYVIGSVVDSKNNKRKLTCHCGAVNCRKRLY